MDCAQSILLSHVSDVSEKEDDGGDNPVIVIPCKQSFRFTGILQAVVCNPQFVDMLKAVVC